MIMVYPLTATTIEEIYIIKNCIISALFEKQIATESASLILCRYQPKKRVEDIFRSNSHVVYDHFLVYRDFALFIANENLFAHDHEIHYIDRTQSRYEANPKRNGDNRSTGGEWKKSIIDE